MSTGQPIQRVVAFARQRSAGVALIFALVLANMAWFARFTYRTLMGDDLYLFAGSNVKGGYASSVIGALSDDTGAKYRPITTAVLSVATDAFGGNYLEYKAFNICLLSLACCLAALIAYRLSGGNRAAAVFVGVAMVVSRFNTYYVLQAFGIMENLGLCFTLAMVLAAQQAYTSQKRKYLYWSFAAYGAAIYTHERYLFLVGFAIVVALVLPGTVTLSRRILDAAIPVAITLSNYIIKVYIIKIHFFTGGGGTDITPDIGEIISFVERGALNSIGYNTGPAYLSAKNAHTLGTRAVLVCLVFAVPAILTLCWAMYRQVQRRGIRPLLAPVALGLALFGPLLLSASVTFRQEYRWLFPPYVVLLLGLAWAVGRLRWSVTWSTVIVAVLMLGSLTVDVYYRQYVTKTYFFAGQELADTVRDRVLDQYRDSLSDTTVFIVSHGDPVLNQFYLASGLFFPAYAPGVPTDVRVVDDMATAVPGPDTREHIIVFDYRNGNSVVEVGRFDIVPPGS